MKLNVILIEKENPDRSLRLLLDGNSKDCMKVLDLIEESKVSNIYRVR